MLRTITIFGRGYVLLAALIAALVTGLLMFGYVRISSAEELVHININSSQDCELWAGVVDKIHFNQNPITFPVLDAPVQDQVAFIKWLHYSVKQLPEIDVGEAFFQTCVMLEGHFVVPRYIERNWK